MNGSAYTLTVVLLVSLFQLRSIVASLTVDCHMSQSLDIIYKKACFFFWKLNIILINQCQLVCWVLTVMKMRGDWVTSFQSHLSNLTVTFQFIAWQIFIVCRNNSPLCRALNVNAWNFNTVCGHSEVVLVDMEHQIAHSGIFLVRNWFLKWNKLFI